MYYPLLANVHFNKNDNGHSLSVRCCMINPVFDSGDTNLAYQISACPFMAQNHLLHILDMVNDVG